MNTPQTVELDGRALKAEAEKSHEFLTLVYYGANRERNREVTDIEQMRKSLVDKHKETLDPSEWLQAFKKLEDMGMGALILGRRGNPNRFRWNYSLKAIGTAAVNGTKLTAHRIAPKMKGDKVVNDYHSSQPSRLSVNVKHVDEERGAVATRRVEAPIRLSRPAAAPETSSIKHMVYLALRSDYTFEADIPTLSPEEADAICRAIRRCVK